jgi:hypothetical protein
MRIVFKRGEMLRMQERLGNASSAKIARHVVGDLGDAAQASAEKAWGKWSRTFDHSVSKKLAIACRSSGGHVSHCP